MTEATRSFACFSSPSPERVVGPCFRRSATGRLRLGLIPVWLLLLTLTSFGQAVHSFSLTEWLDHDWQHELVAVEAPGDLPERLVVVQQDGSRRPAQLYEGRIYSLLDLAPAATATYEVVEAEPTHSLAIRQTPQGLELTNDRVGVRLAETIEQAARGPILAVRLADGTWTGASQLADAPAIDTFQATISARGPVFTEVRLSYGFAGGSWDLRVRLIEGEPVIRLSEQMSVDSPFTWTMTFADDWQPDHGLYRHGISPSGKPRMALLAEPLKDQTYTLFPWLKWWFGNGASFFSLFKGKADTTYLHEKGQLTPMPKAGSQATEDIQLEEGGPRYGDAPVLFTAAGQGASWVAPGSRIQPIHIRKTDAGPTMTMPVDGLGREWLLGTCILEQAIKPDTELSLPQQALIKHLETPLQQVVDMVLELPPDEVTDYPRVFIQREDLETIGKRYPEPSHPRKQWIWDFLYAPTPEVEQQLRDKTLGGVRAGVMNFTEHVENYNAEGMHQRRPSMTAFTHHIAQRINGAMFSADLALSRDLFSPEERQRLRAQLAFIAARMASPDFYSLERDFRANPNMTTMRHATVGMLGCLLAQHPQAQAWVDLGTVEINRQIEHWIDDNGGWLECPHYQTTIIDGVLLLRAAHYAGFSEDIYSEKLLSSILYLAKITTPPDPRWDDVRHMPPAGNSYRMERSCIFSIFAKLHQERNPQAANALQWTWYEMNKPMFMAIGGDTRANYFSEFLVADFEPTGPPDWQSELFPKSSAILRSGFPTARETQLYLLQGPFMQHYDHDRGSFALWGKGRPLSLDWGYHGRMPAWQHNMIDLHGIGHIRDFQASRRYDYLRSEMNGWTRQVLFVKRDDPLAPNYFVIRDRVPENKPYDWWFWLYTTKPPRLKDSLITMTGQHDVDLDIWMPAHWREQFDRLSPKELAELEPPDAPGAEGGFDGITLDEPEPTAALKTRMLSIPAVQGYPNRAGWKVDMPLTQEGLKLTIPAGETVVWVLYPRLRNQPKPTITALDEQARVLQVQTEAGTDTILLSPDNHDWTRDGISLKGVAAVHPSTPQE